MDKQEPEKQKLEEELMEPAEDVNTPSDEPVLSDTDASDSDEEPVSDTQAVDDARADSAEEDADAESDTDVSGDEGTEETPVDTKPEEDLASDPSAEDEAEEAVGDESATEAPVGETTEEAPVDAESEDASAEEESEPAAEDDPSDWFVVHCYSGYENKVRHNLEQRIETMGMKDMIFDVVVPTQEEIEVKDGKRRTVERHIFPGYVLVNMILTEESWYVVRNTPGVTGFVGMGNNPTPLRPEEVAQIVKRMEADAPTVKVTFKVGERVRIIDGPFNDFRGVVSEIDMERTKVRVMVSFFGRETPVELDFLQVEKA
jgi:transcriptional antiterminator NusG